MIINPYNIFKESQHTAIQKELDTLFNEIIKTVDYNMLDPQTTKGFIPFSKSDAFWYFIRKTAINDQDKWDDISINFNKKFKEKYGSFDVIDIVNSYTKEKQKNNMGSYILLESTANYHEHKFYLKDVNYSILNSLYPSQLNNDFKNYFSHNSEELNKRMANYFIESYQFIYNIGTSTLHLEIGTYLNLYISDDTEQMFKACFEEINEDFGVGYMKSEEDIEL